MVFKFAPNGKEAKLYTFTGGNDGGSPAANLIADNSGNLYSSTTYGGTSGFGTIFKLTPKGAETVLYSFSGGNDGANPSAGVIEDQGGNFYGTTTAGGGSGCNGVGCGTVFEINANGTESVRYSFVGGSDGAYPTGSLIEDQAGNLYGTTYEGGKSGCNGNACGTIFEVAPNGTETVLYRFTGGTDGGAPQGWLITDSSGKLYGTAAIGGSKHCNCGTVYAYENGSLTVLHTFEGGTKDGANPLAGLFEDQAGNLYGSTSVSGGNHHHCGCGIVFKVSPNGSGTVFRVHE